MKGRGWERGEAPARFNTSPALAENLSHNKGLGRSCGFPTPPPKASITNLCPESPEHSPGLLLSLQWPSLAKLLLLGSVGWGFAFSLSPTPISKL